MSNAAVIELLTPVLQRLPSLDLTQADAAKAALTKEFAPGGEWGLRLRAQGQTGLTDGWLCNRGEPGSRFSRVAKPDAGLGFSIDAVQLAGEGPWHKHLKGEVNFCIALKGEPRFCGHEPGWAVFAPGSSHVPKVDGGEMLIFYLLPEGAVEWKRA